MPSQNDLIAGLDLSPLASVTQAQLMQTINQMAPLDNIGFVLVSTTRPDITNNPRMIRYFWLDITTPANPVLKRYVADRTVPVDADLSWEALGVADGAILTRMIATNSSTGGVDLSRIKLNDDYSAGTPYLILRVAANGKDIEAVTLTTAITDGGGIGFSSLTLTGIGPQKYLGVTAGVLGYRYLDGALDFSSALNNRIPAATGILPGTAKYLLRTNGGATAPEWIASNDADLFQDGDIKIAALAVTGAVTGDIIRFDGTKWVRVTPSINITNSVPISTTGTLSTTGGTGDMTNQVHVIAHGLGAKPKSVRVVAINLAIDAGYAVGDEVELYGFRNTGSNNGITAICSDAVNITALLGAITLEIPNKGTAAYAAIDETKWRVKAYAWL